MSAKKSFKVRFDKKSKKGDFFGLSQIALKAPALDPSYVHNQVRRSERRRRRGEKG